MSKVGWFYCVHGIRSGYRHIPSNNYQETEVTTRFFGFVFTHIFETYKNVWKDTINALVVINLWNSNFSSIILRISIFVRIIYTYLPSPKTVKGIFSDRKSRNMPNTKYFNNTNQIKDGSSVMYQWKIESSSSWSLQSQSFVDQIFFYSSHPYIRYTISTKHHESIIIILFLCWYKNKNISLTWYNIS